MQLVGNTTCLPLRVGQNLVDSLPKTFSAAEPWCRGTFEFCFTGCEVAEKKYISQLWRVDHSARRSMKNAANCAKHGELQGFMKPLLVERILQLRLTGRGYIHLRVEESHSSLSDCSLVGGKSSFGLNSESFWVLKSLADHPCDF